MEKFINMESVDSTRLPFAIYHNEKVIPHAQFITKKSVILKELEHRKLG